jgi:hypothetical protein
MEREREIESESMSRCGCSSLTILLLIIILFMMSIFDLLLNITLLGILYHMICNKLDHVAKLSLCT